MMKIQRRPQNSDWRLVKNAFNNFILSSFFLTTVHSLCLSPAQNFYSTFSSPFILFDPFLSEFDKALLSLLLSLLCVLVLVFVGHSCQKFKIRNNERIFN
mmetsp:Transcript_49021/g.56355  ORF Transcript_49021/g.56355 Transcript_49021/m.56355 type:complete len:100 (+) Transcript_49021:983-1282(+)